MNIVFYVPIKIPGYSQIVNLTMALQKRHSNVHIVPVSDIEDNIYTNETSNGLTYAVEKFKSHDISGHITFLKGERSRLATISSKIL